MRRRHVSSQSDVEVLFHGSREVPPGVVLGALNGPVPKFSFSADSPFSGEVLASDGVTVWAIIEPDMYTPIPLGQSARIRMKGKITLIIPKGLNDQRTGQRIAVA